MKSNKTKNAILLSIIAIGIFALLVFCLDYFILPLIPKNFQSWLTSYVGAGVLTLTIFASFAQITGYSLRDLVSDSKNSPSNNLTQIDGRHKAKGEGEVTGLDIQEPVIIKPGTKSTAEGKGKITATRISNSREDNNESN